MFVAYFAEALQIRRRRRNIPTLPKDRLNQNSGNLFGVYLLGKKQVELIERFLDDLFFRRRGRQGKLMPEWERGNEHRWLENKDQKGLAVYVQLRTPDTPSTDRSLRCRQSYSL